MENIYKYILNLIFPKKCINCKREGSFLCEDCLSLIEINQIKYCACANNPKKGILKCSDCPSNIYCVHTVLNEKQYLTQKLYLKAKNLSELNNYFSYLIITYIKNEANIKLDNNFSIFFKDEEMKNIALNLAKFTKLKIGRKTDNILFLTKKYPKESINLKNKKVFVISLFR
ncbi:MAG: hypothetical protein PHG24_00890 [Candidatus Pacebacteria bacterium]|nr:hypothetical protein [Candidatus Paceibacterota bacterium]